MNATLDASRPLGRSAAMVSPVALGCGNFGGVGSAPEFFGQGLTEDQALELMDAAWEFGITHFDTADAYGGGRSELAIGRWIQSRGVNPQLTTKTFNPMKAGADRGLKPERITRQLRASLDRLGVASGVTAGHPELLLAAHPHRRAGATPAVRAAAGRLPGIQPAGRRLAHGQVSSRRAVPGRLADDPAPRAVPGVPGRPDLRRP